MEQGELDPLWTVLLNGRWLSPQFCPFRALSLSLCPFGLLPSPKIGGKWCDADYPSPAARSKREGFHTLGGGGFQSSGTNT